LVNEISLYNYVWSKKNIKRDKTLIYTSETCILTKRDRKDMNIFERKVYRKILSPLYDNGKETCEHIKQ